MALLVDTVVFPYRPNLIWPFKSRLFLKTIKEGCLYRHPSFIDYISMHADLLLCPCIPIVNFFFCVLQGHVCWVTILQYVFTEYEVQWESRFRPLCIFIILNLCVFTPVNSFFQTVYIHDFLDF